MKPVNHRFQEASFSKLLHLPFDGTVDVPLDDTRATLMPLDDTDSTDSKRGLAVVSIISLVRDF